MSYKWHKIADSGFAAKKRKLKKMLTFKSKFVRDILAEFIGTFILVSFAVGGGAQYVLSRQTYSSFLTVNFAGGIGFMMAFYFSGGVSGGCVNPAVAFGFCLKGILPWRNLPVFALAEVAGAFVAAAVQYGVYYDALNHFDGGNRSTVGENATAGIFATYPQEFVSTTNAFFDQVFGTFILMGCVYAISDKRNMMPNVSTLPLHLGLIVFVIGTAFGFNCGYAINPARDLGPRLFTAVAGWGAEPFSFRNYNWFWVPIVGPMTGAFVGWVVYNVFIENHWPSEEDQDDHEQADEIMEEKALSPSNGKQDEGTRLKPIV